MKSANNAVESSDIEMLIAIYDTIKYYIIEHRNLEFFWESLAPYTNGYSPDSDFVKAIDKAFGSFDDFKR